MKILLVILLIFLIYVLASKFMRLSNKVEHFTHLFDFDSLKKDGNQEKMTFHLEKHSTRSFHPKFTIQNGNKEPYLFINSFWEMHDLNIPIKDKDKNVISTIKHYNYNIYNYTLDDKDNKFRFINNNNTLFTLTSGKQEFTVKGSMKKGVVFHLNQQVGLIKKSGNSYVFKMDNDLSEYKNIMAVAFMIYLQLIKEQQHISI